MAVKNKVVIVTGASSGIGKATAKLLGESGAKVVLAARDEEKLQQVVTEIKEKRRRSHLQSDRCVKKKGSKSIG